MIYIPRLYNPNPLISLELWRMGFRVKKIDAEYITIKPRGWDELSKKYDEYKSLNSKNS